jgi:opacity protein-like surface antigen
MKKLLTIALMTVSTLSIAGLNDFKVIGGNATATFTQAQVEKMLDEGNTCLKKGVSVKYHSKNVTKKECQSSTKLGLRVIKVKNLEINLYKKVMGFTKS